MGFLQYYNFTRVLDVAVIVGAILHAVFHFHIVCNNDALLISMRIYYYIKSNQTKNKLYKRQSLERTGLFAMNCSSTKEKSAFRE